MSLNTETTSVSLFYNIEKISIFNIFYNLRPQYPNLYRCLKRRLGHSLRASLYKGLWSDREKRLHRNILELKAGSLALKRFKGQCQNQTELVATDNSMVVSYINKQGGTHSVEMVCSPVENHDLVPSLPDNFKSQAHTRVPECDGRTTVTVEPSPINRMVPASAGVQTDLSKVVHSSCRSICHSSEPQSSITYLQSQTSMLGT